MASDTGEVTCAVCDKTFPPAEVRRVSDTTRGTKAALQSQLPGIQPDQHVCLPDIARMRRLFL